MSSSLRKFQELVETEFPLIKKHITVESSSKIVLEDYDGRTIFGCNPDIGVLFETPCKFPIKKFSVKYNEKDSFFNITLDLK